MDASTSVQYRLHDCMMSLFENQQTENSCLLYIHVHNGIGIHTPSRLVLCFRLERRWMPLHRYNTELDSTIQQQKQDNRGTRAHTHNCYFFSCFFFAGGGGEGLYIVCDLLPNCTSCMIAPVTLEKCHTYAKRYYTSPLSRMFLAVTSDFHVFTFLVSLSLFPGFCSKL